MRIYRIAAEMAGPNQAFEINIRDPGGRALLVTVDPNWTVRHVKEEFSRQAGIPVGQFRLVFAGQALNEGVKLQVSYPANDHCWVTGDLHRTLAYRVIVLFTVSAVVPLC